MTKSTTGPTGPIHINKKKFDNEASSLTGAQIKALGGFADGYDLFHLQGEGDTAGTPIPDGQAVAMRPGMHFRVLPGNRNFGQERGRVILHADRQREVEELRAAGYDVEVRVEGAMIGLIIRGFPVPGAYNVNRTRLLLRVPMDPNGAMDMFWVSPGLTLRSGGAPKQGEVMEPHFGEQWQRFSWHWQSPWVPRRDTPLSFLEFVTARLASGV